MGSRSLCVFCPLALAILVGCESSTQAPSASVPPKGEVWLSAEQVARAHIQVAQAARHPVAEKIVTGGRVAFDDQLVSHVFSPVNGRVTRIDAQLGEKVKKGQPLAQIESPDLAQAYSDQAKAQADLTAAEHDIQRQRDLVAAQAASAATLEQSEDNYRKAQAEMNRARLKMKLLHASRDDLVSQNFLLRSPIDGEVVGRNLNPGAEIQGMLSSANIVNELFTIGDLSRVWLLADIYELDLGRVHPGDKLDVTSVAYSGEAFSGVVDFVSQVLDPVTRTARVRMTVENAERKLKPEMYLTAAVTLGAREALTVPRTAVMRLGEQSIIFVQVGRTEAGVLRFVPRPVATGAEDADWIEITHGLEPGEALVTEGAILLSSQV
jgi:cobalt-zinc-cadmium efflux system membrane fusion protein